MNHIYRRIWNVARQCWVVASELTKVRGKRTSFSRTDPLALVAVAFSLLGSASAHADVFGTKCDKYLNVYFCIPGAGFDDSYKAADAALGSSRVLAMGNGAYVDGKESIVFGHQARSFGTRTAAFGYSALNRQGYSTAFGAFTYTDGVGATAIGNVARVEGADGVAVGSNARVQTMAGKDGVAIGANARAGTSGYTGAIAIGGGADAGRDSIALGHGAMASSVAGAVALGTASVASEANTVSVGSSARKRRVVNVEDARLSTSSSDAVTGKQLHATNLKIGDLSGMMTKGTHADSYVLGTGSVSASANSVSVGSAGKKRRIQNIADGTLVAGSTDAVTGSQLHATNNRVTAVTTTANAAAARLNAAAPAIGQSATAEGSGTTASAAMGQSAKAYGANSVALGADARAMVDANGDKATGSGAVSIGANSRSGNGAVATGLRATAIGDRAIAVGNEASAAEKHATAMGYKANASAEGATALGYGAEASHAGSVALGKESRTTAANQISVGSDSVKRKIVNVGEGVLSATSSEAVTGKQLNDTNVNVAAAQSEAQAAKTTADAAKVNAGKALAETALLGGLVSQVAATGDVRLGGRNSGTLLDVRNSANAGRKITGVADGALSTSSTEAVTGKQLNQTNVKVAAAQADAAAANTVADEAKVAAGKALAETVTLGGLVSQVAATGDVRLGGKNSGTVLDVRNSANANRKISGVADAALSASSSEVATGGQLFASNLRISSIEEQGRLLALGGESGTASAIAGIYSVAIGNGAAASVVNEGGTAIGAFSAALAKNSVALGRAASVEVSADDGFALGAGSYVAEVGGVALGVGAEVSMGAARSVAIGSGSIADESDTVSIGSDSLKRRLVNVARGTSDHNATTIAQLKDALATLGGGAGMDASGNVVSPTYALQGGVQNTVGDALTVLDGAVVTTTSRVANVETQLRSVFQDTPSTRSDGVTQLTLAGANGMVISNVANGLIAAGSRDAVNGGQLHSMQQQLNGRMDGLEQRIDDQPQARAMAAASTPSPSTEEIAPTPETSGSPQIASTGEGDKPTPQPKSKQDDTPKPQVDTADLEKMLARANEYTDGAISNVERRLDKMDKRFNRMAAMSSAQTAMAMNTAGLATYNRLGAGVGYSEGESAMAVGYQRVLNEKGSATFSLNGAFTNSGERSMGVGVGIGW